MRPLPRVWTSASVNAAAHEIRDSGLPAVGVTEGFFYVAVVTQSSLAAVLAAGVHPDDSISQAYDVNANALPPYATADRALEIFSRGEVSAIPIVDDYGHLMGVLTPADLFPKRDNAPRPAMVGGMATPFGVYLTTGTIGAGAKGWALVATGALMSTVFAVIGLLASQAIDFARLQGLQVSQGFSEAFQFALFLLAFRLMPIAGIHAAEHKVVHAIERGEELTRETVRRMPRVHPRCGTNLVVGLSILIGVASAEWLLKEAEPRVILAAIATLVFWKPLGSLVQYWGTTKEPSDKQIDMGIRSAEELLTGYATGPGGRRNFFWRLWNSGIFHVLAGGILVLCGIELLQLALGVHLIPTGL
jgi:hypothetical protein